MTRTWLLAPATVLAGLFLAGAAEAATLDDVRTAGKVRCGISTGLAGFSDLNANQEWEGLDVDFCKAVAAAVLGDAKKVEFVPLTNKERFTALQSGEVELLARNTTWTLTRDSNLGLDFTGVNYYDGQGFMVPRALNVNSALELGGARICIKTGTTTELNLADYFRANDLEAFQPVLLTDDAEVRRNYVAEACDAYTTDASALAAMRSTLPDPTAHIILPEIISKEPLGPVVRQGDDQWADIVRWALNAMITAEEYGVTSANVDEVRTSSESPEIRRLLGVKETAEEEGLGTMLGLSDDFAYQIVKQVGNYSESFERHIGVNTPIGLERGLNALWSEGGILYAPPMR
ncbi:MAG: amino acid ABC transporter substrate-binding protein [Alphaproteobacteria bacterium]|nr:amino acid ABC transporter substrate-binding protein [Alphaproteobacteria bacterium]